jgi:hypothetical protein
VVTRCPIGRVGPGSSPRTGAAVRPAIAVRICSAAALQDGCRGPLSALISLYRCRRHLGGGGGGSGGWVDDSPLARVEVPAGHANLHGMNSGSVGDRGCKGLWGEVGTEAAFAEVIQSGTVTRRAVQAPISAFVVGGEYEKPFIVRVLNSHDAPLAEVEEPAGSLVAVARRAPTDWLGHDAADCHVPIDRVGLSRRGTLLPSVPHRPLSGNVGRSRRSGYPYAVCLIEDLT